MATFCDSRSDGTAKLEGMLGLDFPTVRIHEGHPKSRFSAGDPIGGPLENENHRWKNE
jgi:hypothetical protein